MKLIQLVLLAVVVGGTVLFVARKRSRLIDNVIVVAFATGGALMVCVPEISEWLAATLQVGRGVDVVIYFMLVFLWFLSIVLYSKVRNQQAQLVALTRSIAISQANVPDEAKPTRREIIPMPTFVRKAS
jgi:hypothetical protein